jgi:hypothetical protein
VPRRTQCDDPLRGKSALLDAVLDAKFALDPIEGEVFVKVAVQIQPADASPADVEYTWDPDTDILSAQLSPRTSGDGLSGSVGLEGNDGSWVILDVAAGRIAGVEVAVWPDVRKLPALSLPTQVEDVQVMVPASKTKADVASLEVDTHLIAEADATQRNFHVRLGSPRGARTVRVARDLLFDVDDKNRISGLWLLNVPPCPPSPTFEP